MLKFIYLGRYDNPEEDFTQMIVKRTGMPEDEAQQLVLDANATDPTGEDYSYTLWILQQAYKYDTVNLPDDEVRYFLESFHKLKNKSSWAELIESEYPQVSNPKDINQYDINTLASAVSHALGGGEALSLTEEQKRSIEEGTEDLGNGVYKITNVEALLYMSSGTGWNCKGRPEVAEGFISEGAAKVYITGDDKYLYLSSRNVLFDSAGRSVDLEKFVATLPEEAIEDLGINLKGLAPLPGSYDVLLDRDPYRVLYIQGNDEATRAALWYFAQGSTWCFGNSSSCTKNYARDGVYLVLEDAKPIAVWCYETGEFHDVYNSPISEDSDVVYAYELLEESGLEDLPSMRLQWEEASAETVLSAAMDGNESAREYLLEEAASASMLRYLGNDSDLYNLILDYGARDEEGKIINLSDFTDLIDTAVEGLSPYSWYSRASAFIESGMLTRIHPNQILDVINSATKTICDTARRDTGRFDEASSLYTDIEKVLNEADLENLLQNATPYLPEGTTEIPQEWKDNVALSQLTLISTLSNPTLDYGNYSYLDDREALMQIYEHTGDVIKQTNDIPLVLPAIQGLYALNYAERVDQSDLDPDRINPQFGTYKVPDENSEWGYRNEDLDKFVKPIEPIAPLKALQEKELPEVDISQVVAPLRECFPPTIISILEALRSGAVPHEDFSNIWDDIPSTNSLELLLMFSNSFDDMEDRILTLAKSVSIEKIVDSLNNFFTNNVIQQIFSGRAMGVPRTIRAALFKLWFVDNTNYLLNHIDMVQRRNLEKHMVYVHFPEFYDAWVADFPEKTSSKNSITYICKS